MISVSGWQTSRFGPVIPDAAATLAAVAGKASPKSEIPPIQFGAPDLSPTVEEASGWAAAKEEALKKGVEKQPPAGQVVVSKTPPSTDILPADGKSFRKE